MDQESLAQIKQIVTAATETIEARLGDRIAEVREHSGAVEARIAEVQEHSGVVEARIAEVREHSGVVEARIAEVRRELGDQISAVQQRTEILDNKISEVQRHTGVLIEDLHHKFELVIEGQQVLHREIATVRTELQQDSQETRALLRLSYQQLQQRVENLE